MQRKLLTALVSACALVAALTGPATASADTLTVTNAKGVPASSKVHFDSHSTTVQTNMGSYYCDEFSFWADITQNQADPVTMALLTSAPSPYYSPPSLEGCHLGTGASIDHSNIEATDQIEFNADGTGTLPLRVTETWTSVFGSSTCVREGVLDLAYTPDTPNSGAGNPVYFEGNLYLVSGSWGCPYTADWQGTFDIPTDDEHADRIYWVVTP